MNPEDLTRLALVEQQMERICSDIESEKGTRARVNTELNRRLDDIDAAQRKLERIIYMAAGGLAVLQFFLSK